MSNNQPEQTSKRLSIFCRQTGKLLFRLDSEALYTWCRGHHAEERITWDVIGKIIAGTPVEEVTVQDER